MYFNFYIAVIFNWFNWVQKYKFFSNSNIILANNYESVVFSQIGINSETPRFVISCAKIKVAKNNIAKKITIFFITKNLQNCKL